MTIPTQGGPHLSAIAELIRPGLSPVFPCDANGAAHYDRYCEMIRTRDTHRVPTTELAVLRDGQTLVIAISKLSNRQTSTCFGGILVWLATEMGFKYFQTWETATLLQRRPTRQASDDLHTVPTKSNAAPPTGSNLNRNGGPSEDPAIRFWFAGIVPFLCLPVVRVEDFDEDDDVTVVIDEDSDDASDGSNINFQLTPSNNNIINIRNRFTNHHNPSHSPSMTSRDFDVFHRRLEQTAAKLVHGGLFILSRHAAWTQNWSFISTVDNALFKHRPDINVLHTHLAHACGRLATTFNALALHVIIDAQLKESAGLCHSERKLFTQCMQQAYKRLDDVLEAPCVVQAHDPQCLWAKGLNGWLAVQRHCRTTPYSDIFKMSVRGVVKQCSLRASFRRLKLERDNQQWLVVTNEKDESYDNNDMGGDDDLDEDDEDMDDDPRNAGMALVASVRKNKVIKSGIVVLQHVKRFLDYTAEIEIMLYADSLPLRLQIAADLTQAGVITDSDVVSDAAIVLRDDDDLLLEAEAFPMSGSGRRALT